MMGDGVSITLTTGQRRYAMYVLHPTQCHASLGFSSLRRGRCMMVSTCAPSSSALLSQPPRLQCAATDFVLFAQQSQHPVVLPHLQHETDIPLSSRVDHRPPSPSSSIFSGSTASSSTSSCSSVLASPTISQERTGCWSCFYGCGKQYKKSSGRSIHRHVTRCFRQDWPDGETLSEEAVSALISSQQERGLLQTGLRRWKMRQSRRNADDLPEAEVWACPFGCGKRYRSTSSRSIQNHANGCINRNDDGVGDVDVKRLRVEHDAKWRHVGQREDEREPVIRTAGIKGEDQGKGGFAASIMPGCGIGQSLSSSPSDAVFSVSMPPPPIGAFRAPSLLDDLCSPSSTSSLASVASTFQEWELPSRPEPALVPNSLQGVELLSLQQQLNVDTLTRQKQQVAAELQQLLLDIYARDGTRHPVFHHPATASCLTWLLTQGASGTAAACPSTTQTTQLGSSSQRPSCLSPALSTTGLHSSPRSPRFLNHSPVDTPSDFFDTSTFLVTSQADAAGTSAAVVHPRRASPTVSPPVLLGLGFSGDSFPSVPHLCPSIPARPPSRLSLPPSPYSPPLPYLPPPSDGVDPQLLELQPCHIVDPYPSTPAQSLLHQLNARVPELRLVPLGNRDANALRKVRLSGQLDFIVDRMEYFRDVIDELYLSSADVETQSCGVEEEQQQPYFHATFFVRQRQCV